MTYSHRTAVDLEYMTYVQMMRCVPLMPLLLDSLFTVPVEILPFFGK